MTKYPDITVRLTDGNAFAIMGAVARGLRTAGINEAEVALFFTEATAADYDQLLKTAMRWVSVTA